MRQPASLYGAPTGPSALRGARKETRGVPNHGALTAKVESENAADTIVSKPYIYVLCSFLNVLSQELKTMAACEIEQLWGSPSVLSCVS